VARETDERNQATRDRLRALGERLSDTDLARPIDATWTAAGLMAHVAFWDRFVHARWQLAAATGSRAPQPLDEALLDLINDASLRGWNAIPSRTAIDECLTAADELDRLVASLDPDLVDELVQDGRERLVDRSLHRGEHLETIESAFPSP
jgi:hypothetical protein